MTKKLAVIAATFLALTGLLGTGAEAGFNVRIRLPADFSSVQKTGCYEDCDYDEDDSDDDEYERSDRRHFYQPGSRRERPTARAEAKGPIRRAAVAAPEPEARQLAKTEGSSVTTADDEAAESSTAGPKKKVATAKDLGCKSFFASAGMTLSVPCE
jgi:hypothetical protein